MKKANFIYKTALPLFLFITTTMAAHAHGPQKEIKNLDVIQKYSALMKGIENSKNADEFDGYYHQLSDLFDKPGSKSSAAKLCSHLNSLSIGELKYLEDAIQSSSSFADDCKELILAKVAFSNSWSTDALELSIQTIKKIPFEEREVPEMTVKPDGTIRPLFSGNLKDKEIMLTFDDGPSAATPYILDALKAAGVKAAFFHVGKRVVSDKSDGPSQKKLKEERKSILKRILAEGHILANHSYSHTNAMGSKNLKGNLTKDYFMSEFVGGHLSLYRGAGYVDPFFRFPNGDQNNVIAREVRDAGVKIFHWTLDTEDWRFNAKELSIAQRNRSVLDTLVNGFKSYKNGIMLMHDINMHSAEALPGILNYLANNGYKVVLMKPKNRNVSSPSYLPVISEATNYLWKNHLDDADVYPPSPDDAYKYRSRIDFDLMFGR
ncbi:polysaccharide deacetylase family protein [Bdellovibrio reynosensis]|uniref:Polysaccharide deacetylase family protein n=1 Tax=Bdellovibrio reynosensis TaxID=2835041 RepID=A0ABY4C713_9BACT|nr:polysaccharide deacetylase family protein [Bdellovibrio reynosensis]UOF00756.1 polysaccharide deacetylase family protein [Bdellovibrio reynosensis]